MDTAKLFVNGNSQAIRLPKEYRFKNKKEVYINKIGDTVLLFPKETMWENAWSALSMFSDDFMENRNQPQLEDRDSF